MAAYVYPAYVADDPRLRPFGPMGIGEWETVMTMQQRNPGHYWKRYPLWGYVNEADSAVMEMEINQAADHGVNVFIFDWYWYDGRTAGRSWRPHLRMGSSRLAIAIACSSI